MISAQNVILPHLGADIRPRQPEPDKPTRLMALALFLAGQTAQIDLSAPRIERTKL